MSATDIGSKGKLPFKRVTDLTVEGQRVFVRVDFNVPQDDAGEISDDSRIQAALPTIKHLRSQGARIILASHFGRPKGKRKPEFSLERVGIHLATLLDQEVLLPEDCIGDAPRRLVQNLRESQIVLLENLRFHPEEEAGDDAFSRSLASLADIYVNDAFGAAHRAHASITGVPKYTKDKAAGFLMIKEYESLSLLLEHPASPFVAILGGAKVSDKIGVIENLLKHVQCLVVGGAMAATFLVAQGHDMGASLVEVDKLDLARRALTKAGNRNVEIVLPVDHVITQDITGASGFRYADNGQIEAGWKAVDIGPKTREIFAQKVSQGRTVFWNGPMGIFEVDAFAAGTQAVAQAVAHGSSVSVVGGGDSVAAVKKAGISPFITHISTGGGASLEFLEGAELPGVEALRNTKAG